MLWPELALYGTVATVPYNAIVGGRIMGPMLLVKSFGGGLGMQVGGAVRLLSSVK